ncbi:MAG TPA: DUF3179 domain-containing (seleno)protein [Gemmataceae bacterium]|nr:DUF3179 domain-containing (seleno)protein [Gemmataceae bacterium]
MPGALLLVSIFITMPALAADQQGSLIARPGAFPTLINPNCSHCRDEAKRRAKELRDDDRVLCWIRGYSDGGAIPFRFFLNRYPVISDSYGVFVYDHDAGYARGYAPSYNFRFQGWRNGVMVMKHKDGTLYSCLSGRAFEGPKKGTRLTPIPTLVSDWGVWLKSYPQAVAYHMFDKYKPVELPARPNEDASKSRGPVDPRLPEDTPVLGVVIGNEKKAYPLTALEKNRIIYDTLDGHPVVVVWQGSTRTAAAYSPEAIPPRKYPAPRPNADGESTMPEQPKNVLRSVDLVHANDVAAAQFMDKDSGSHWDVAGRAVDGKMKSWTLTWRDSVQVKWFAWSAEYPETSIHGK